jgi:hypothetical protein
MLVFGNLPIGYPNPMRVEAPERRPKCDELAGVGRSSPGKVLAMSGCTSEIAPRR